MNTNNDHINDELGSDYTCMMCGAVFNLKEGEEGFYIQRGLSLPKRCVSCRAERKAQKMREGTRSAPQLSLIHISEPTRPY